MRINRTEVTQAFERFASAYDTTDPKIALKIEHTLKVADLCNRISDSEGMSSAAGDVAWLSGMLHDIGRFEQLARYGTFSDASSINHATLSARLLFDDDLLSRFCNPNSLTDENIRALKTAIALHNAYELPETLQPNEQIHCTVLRDADKKDLMRVMVESSISTVISANEESLRNSEVSPDVLQAFNERHAILTAIKKTPADFILGHCALGWELVYPESRLLALRQGYLAQLFDKPFNSETTQAVFKNAKASMFSWLQESA